MIDKNWLMVIRINLIMFGKTINNIIGVVTIAVWAVGSMTVSINQYHYIWKCECSYCMLFSTTTALHNGPAVLFGNGCLGFTIVWICGDMNEGTDVSLRPVKNTFCELHLWEKTWFLNKLKTNSEGLEHSTLIEQSSEWECFLQLPQTPEMSWEVCPPKQKETTLILSSTLESFP